MSDYRAISIDVNQQNEYSLNLTLHLYIASFLIIELGLGLSAILNFGQVKII
jgi:hypothetical protein